MLSPEEEKPRTPPGSAQSLPTLFAYEIVVTAVFILCASLARVAAAVLGVPGFVAGYCILVVFLTLFPNVIFNAALPVGLAMSGKLDYVRAATVVGGDLIGAVCGQILVRNVMGRELGGVFTPAINLAPSTSLLAAFFFELVATTLFTANVLLHGQGHGRHPFSTAAITTAIAALGAEFDPARSLTSRWEQVGFGVIMAYVVAPWLGSALGVVLARRVDAQLRGARRTKRSA